MRWQYGRTMVLMSQSSHECWWLPPIWMPCFCPWCKTPWWNQQNTTLDTKVMTWCLLGALTSSCKKCCPHPEPNYWPCLAPVPYHLRWWFHHCWEPLPWQSTHSLGRTIWQSARTNNQWGLQANYQVTQKEQRDTQQANITHLQKLLHETTPISTSKQNEGAPSYECVSTTATHSSEGADSQEWHGSIQHENNAVITENTNNSKMSKHDANLWMPLTIKLSEAGLWWSVHIKQKGTIPSISALFSMKTIKWTMSFAAL